MVPLLGRLSQLKPHQVHATSLVIVIFIALSGMVIYILRGEVDWTLVVELAPGCVAGAFLGARLMVKATSQNLRLGFGAFLIFSALWMIFKPFI